MCAEILVGDEAMTGISRSLRLRTAPGGRTHHLACQVLVVRTM